MILYLLTACVKAQVMKLSLSSLQEAHSQAAYANRARIRFPRSWHGAGTAAWSSTRSPWEDASTTTKCGISYRWWTGLGKWVCKMFCRQGGVLSSTLFCYLFLLSRMRNIDIDQQKSPQISPKPQGSSRAIPPWLGVLHKQQWHSPK